MTGKAIVADLLTANKGLTVNGGALTVNAGNVGIGTTDPQAKLHVAGDLKVTGNVGIGTADPKRTLHVEGQEIHSGSAVGGFSFANRDDPNKGAFVNDGANGQRWVWYSAGQKARLWSNGDRLAIDKDGKLGIGTTDPQAELHVNGDLRVDRGATISDLLTANKGLTVNGGALTVIAGNPLNALGGTTVDGGLTINTGGARIGGEIAHVKSSAYSTPLAIQASGTPQGLMCFEAKKDEKWIRKWDLCLGTIGPKSGLEFIETDVDHGRLFLQEGGNVGIGTMDPKARLHVAGDLMVTGKETIVSGKLNVGEGGDGTINCRGIVFPGGIKLSAWGNLIKREQNITLGYILTANL